MSILTWEATHQKEKDRVAREILAVMSGRPQTMRLRLHEYRTAELDAGELFEELNFEPCDLAYMLAALDTPDTVMREEARMMLVKRVGELADCHAECEANDAERQERRIVALEC